MSEGAKKVGFVGIETTGKIRDSADYLVAPTSGFILAVLVLVIAHSHHTVCQRWLPNFTAN